MGAHAAFSSYGGMLVSTDDFYVLGSGLAMVQTSLNVLDRSAYTRADPGLVASVAAGPARERAQQDGARVDRDLQS